LTIVNFKLRKTQINFATKLSKNETKMRKVDEDNQQYNNEWTYMLSVFYGLRSLNS